jgi:hypothetical protein
MTQMTNKLNNKIRNTDSVKASLTERVRQITSAALVAGTLLVGGAAQAAIPRQSSVVDRAVAVQSVLKEKLAADVKPAALPRAQALVAQWGNGWLNWNNWQKWANWGNFLNS